MRKILLAVVELRIDLKQLDRETTVKQLDRETTVRKKPMVSLFRGRKGGVRRVGGWGVWEGVWQQMVQI